MPENSNKLTRFWQELKRRKVIRVMAMYAATAFIIMEAGEIMLPRLGLPDWTVTFLIILLIVGFPIAIILSWIFDVTPEGIRKTESAETEIKPEEAATKTATKRGLRTSDLIIAVLLVAVCILLYPKIFKRDKFRDIRDEDGRISIAVMPFQNMTNDTLWNVWEMGIQNELITQLSFTDELSIRQFQIMNEILLSDGEINAASLTPSRAGNIAGKLQANSFIIGSIKSSADIIRVNAWLYDTQSGEIYQTFQINGNREGDFFAVTDSLASLIRNYLEIKELEKNMDPDARSWASTNSTEALKYFIQGFQSFTKTDYPAAVKHFTNSYRHDSSFYSPWVMLIYAYDNQRLRNEAQQILYEAFAEIEKMSLLEQLWLKYTKSAWDKDPHTCIRYLEETLDAAPYFRGATWQIGWEHQKIHQFDKAAQYYEKALEIDRQWGGTWGWPAFYTYPAFVYHKLGNHDREKEILKLGLRNIPEGLSLLRRLAICALSRGSIQEAEEYLTRYRRTWESEGEYGDWKDFEIGRIYCEGGMITEGIELLLKAVENFPESGWVRYNTGWYLIESEWDVETGMMHIEEALKINPDDAGYFLAKGLGLFKLGRMEEAREVLEKGWELRLNYDHEHYMLLQQVNEALSN